MGTRTGSRTRTRTRTRTLTGTHVPTGTGTHPRVSVVARALGPEVVPGGPEVTNLREVVPTPETTPGQAARTDTDPNARTGKGTCTGTCTDPAVEIRTGVETDTPPPVSYAPL
ncbi:hypothetical protein, partial [Streptomyces brasiliscabiei]|uniref:hypothetical protein n=1 Tax=Streptomyces brasiliscabiei TaxID=2736302 RepID=UPI001C103479